MKKEFPKMTDDELLKELDKLQLELIKLNAQAMTGASSKEAGRIRAIKKDIARIKTVQSSRIKKA